MNYIKAKMITILKFTWEIIYSSLYPYEFVQILIAISNYFRYALLLIICYGVLHIRWWIFIWVNYIYFFQLYVEVNTLSRFPIMIAHTKIPPPPWFHQLWKYAVSLVHNHHFHADQNEVQIFHISNDVNIPWKCNWHGTKSSVKSQNIYPYRSEIFYHFIVPEIGDLDGQPEFTLRENIEFELHIH